MEKLGEVLRAGYATNLDDFSAKIEKCQVNFKPFGELIHSFTIEPRIAPTPIAKSKPNGCGPHVNGNGSTSISSKTFEIYLCDITTPKFKEYLHKMESFILWFIDAASFLDSDDERWKFFVMYD